MPKWFVWAREKSTKEVSDEKILYDRSRKPFPSWHRMCSLFVDCSKEKLAMCDLRAVLSVERTRVHSIAHLIAPHRARPHLAHKEQFYIISHTLAKKAGKNWKHFTASRVHVVVAADSRVVVVVPCSIVCADAWFIYWGNFRVFTLRVEVASGKVHSAQFLLLCLERLFKERERKISTHAGLERKNKKILSPYDAMEVKCGSNKSSSRSSSEHFKLSNVNFFLEMWLWQSWCEVDVVLNRCRWTCSCHFIGKRFFIEWLTS